MVKKLPTLKEMTQEKHPSFFSASNLPCVWKFSESESPRPEFKGTFQDSVVNGALQDLV